MEAPEEDAEFLTLASPTQGVTLRVTPTPYSFGQDGVEPGTAMAWSNHFGWCLVAQPTTGFSLFSLKQLRDSFTSSTPHLTPTIPPTRSVPTDQPIDHIKFAMGDKLVVCGFRDSSVGVWRLKSLVEGNTSPVLSIPPVSPTSSPLVDILPNPSPSSPLLLLLPTSTPPLIYNLETSSPHPSQFPTTFTSKSASWSVKGKQLCIGTSSGQILQFTPEGDLKSEIPVPSSLSSQGDYSWEVTSLEWLENHVWFAVYSKPTPPGESEPVQEDEVLVLTRDPQKGVEETRFLDPTPAFGVMERRQKRWVGRIKNWEPFKHLLFISNAPSSDIGLLSQSSSPSSPSWSSLILSDTSRPTLPQSSTGEEVSPLSLELDLSSNTDDQDGNGQVGVWVLTSQGVLVCWNVVNEKAGGRYEGFVGKSKDVLTWEQEEEEEVPQTESSAPFTTTNSTPSAFGKPSTPVAGGFGSFSSSSSSPSTNKNPTGFGSTGFGFGSAAGGSTPSTPSTGSTFGAPSKQPTFGTSSGFGSFATTSSAPSSSTTGGGFAGFGTSTTTPSTTSKSGSGFSAFGSGGTAPSAFGGGGGGGTGGSGFGSFSKPSSEGSVFGSGGTFGSASTTIASAFGSGGTGTMTNKSGGTTKSVFGSGGGGAFGSTTNSTTPSSGFGAFGSSSNTTPSAFGSSSPQPKPSFSFAPSNTSSSTPPALGNARPRGSNDSDDDEDPEDRGMGNDDEGGGRVDEPPDLEPTKSGLDIGESMREAAEAKKAGGGTGGTFGFGGLGVGAGETKKEEVKPTQSIFGSATTTPTPFGSTAKASPAFGSSASTAFGSSGGFKPATGFSFGQQQPSSAPSTPATPATPATPGKTEEKKPVEPAKPATGFSFGSTSTPGSGTSSFPKPTTTGGFGSTSTSGGFGGFSSTGGGGFGAFAKKEEEGGDAKKEEEKPKSAFSSFGTASPSGGFGAFGGSAGGFGSVKKEEKSEEKKTIEGAEKKESTHGPAAKSPFSFAAASTPTSSTTITDSPKPTTSAFGFGGTASPTTAFPKPSATGGFGAFASSSPSSTGGFSAFGSSSTTTPKPATGFSFAPSKPASPSPAPAFSFAPKPSTPSAEDVKPKIEEHEGDGKAVPKDIEETKPTSTKSLFGFASSPTEEKDAPSSLLSRLSASQDAEEEEEHSEAEEDEGSFEGSEQEGESEHYSDEEQEEEEPEEEDEEEEEISVKEEEVEETLPPPSTGSPSLLSRLSPAPAAAEPPSPEASPSPPAASKPPSFSFGAPASPSPGSTTPVQSPAPASKSPFSFGTTSSSPSPTPSSKPSSFLGFTSSAPRSSSPLSAPPLAPPPAFSSAPKISSPLSFAPPSLPTETKPEASKSPFGGFGGFGSSTATPAKSPAPAPTFSFGGAPVSAPAHPQPKPATGGFSFGSTTSSSAPPPAPIAKAPSAGFSFGAAPPAEPKPTPAPVSKPPTPEVEPPVPTPEVKREGISLAKATAPRVGPELVKGSVPPVQEIGMAGEFLKAYLSVQRDFEILRTNVVTVRDFSKEIAKPLQPPSSSNERIDYDDRNWSLGDLDKLRSIAKDIRPSIEALHGEAIKQKKKTAELQSQMLKAETKREEAARFVRARNDPAFAKMIRIRQLGPEQVENQRRIRLQMEAVRSRLEQLEDHLLALKEKVNEDQKGRSSFKAPSLDSVNRAVRNITVAVTEKTLELDQLAQRLNHVRLDSAESTPQRRQIRHRSPSVALEETINQSSILRQSPAPNGAASKVSSDARLAAAKAALDTEQAAANLKKVLLGLRSDKPAKLNRTASAAVQGSKAEIASDLQLTFAKGPVTADRIPRPRRQAPPPSPRALSPIPLLPSFPSSPAPVRVASSGPLAVETPKAAAPSPLATPSFPPQRSPSPLAFSLASPAPAAPAFSLPTTSAPSFSFGGPSSSAAPPAPMPAPSFGLPPPTSNQPPPLFPSLSLKSAPQISFSTTPHASTPPAANSSSGTRGSASRTSKDRNHSSAAQLKPSTGTPPAAAASSFDWGPLPSNIPGATPSKAPFSFAGGAAGGTGSTPSQGISPSGFVSLGSPFAPSAPSTTNKPTTGGGGFSFGTPFGSSTTASSTPSKPPPAKFSFGAPPDDEEEESEEEEEGEEEERDQLSSPDEIEPVELSNPDFGKYSVSDDEEWERQAAYDHGGSEGESEEGDYEEEEEDEEGLDTIGEEDEEDDE